MNRTVQHPSRPAAAEPENGAAPPGRAADAAALDPLLVDLGRVAELLSVSRRTAKRMHAAGELPGSRRVRRRVLFVFAELRDWVSRGCPDLAPAAGRRRTKAGRGEGDGA